MSNPFTTIEGLDISEQSRTREGEVQRLDRRLFMQLHAFGESRDTDFLVEALQEENLPSVLYEDINDPQGSRAAHLQ